MGFRRRLALLLGLAALGAAVVWLRVLWLQQLDAGTWEAAARALREREERVHAPRGPIVDRDGVPLAEDVPTPRIALVPFEWARRDRWRCEACGAVHHRTASRVPRPPRRCSCRLPDARLTALPPGDVGPLEDLLGVPRGTLEEEARRRAAQVAALAERYGEGLRAGGQGDFFVDDRTRLFEDDMMRRPYVVAPGPVPPEAVRLLELDDEGRFHGLRVQTALRRRHPYGDLAAQLLGYTQPVFREDYEALRQAYGSLVSMDMQVGRRGLERAYNGLLRGHAGSRHLGRDADGGFSVVIAERLPRPGLEVRLSATVGAIQEAQRLLDAHPMAPPEGFAPGGLPSAAFVAMYADDGEIVAWGETPRFDLDRDLARVASPEWTSAVFDPETGEWNPVADLPEGETLDTWREQVVQPDPLVFSRVAEIPVEPGSVMKVPIGLAMLETGRGLPWETYVCRGHGETQPHCHAAHGALTMEEAYGVSCNRWFAFTLGESPLTPFYRTAVARFVDRLGIGHPVFGDFDGSTGRGLWLRRAEWREDEAPEIGRWESRFVAIGQGKVTTTPLHMVRVAALVANGGRLVTPHVVASVGNAPAAWPVADLGLSRPSLDRVREGMFRAVNEPGGTAHAVGWDRIPATVYAKTGTAQVGGTYRVGTGAGEEGPWHHWFVGWSEAPGARPLAFACLYFARTEAAAGRTAAHVTADFLAWWYAQEPR